MIKINNKIKMHNTYECILIDTKTNKVKQKVKTTNIVVNNFIKMLCLYNYNADSYKEIYNCSIGTGTGTPQVTDTALFKLLYTVYGGYTVTCKRVSDTELVWRLTFTVPASTEAVGDITEIGLSTYNSNLLTHALLKDAEGNNISIHKTDIDKLIINVEIHVISNPSENFTPISGSGYPLHISDGLLRLAYSLGITAYTSYYKSNYSRSTLIKAAIINSGYNYTMYSLQDTNRLVYSNNRLPANSFNNRYINAIHFSGLGIIKFPSNLRLNTPVTGLSVGTGDGVTKQFDAPLDLFIKDSDKIYIDGILQTRGVDYTIDNKANRHLRPEITPGSFVKDILSGYVTSNTCEVPFNPFVAYAEEFNTSKYLAVSEKYPMVLELEEDPTIGLDINGVIFKCFYVKTSNGTASLSNVDLVLSYSTDNANYSEVARLSLTGWSISSIKDIPFENTIKAKYWKLSLDFSKASESLQKDKDKYFLQFNVGDQSEVSGAPTHSMLYYKGEPITFTNPPADGAVITMDCNLDRPFKTDQWVIDCNPEFSL